MTVAPPQKLKLSSIAIDLKDRPRPSLEKKLQEITQLHLLVSDCPIGTLFGSIRRRQFG